MAIPCSFHTALVLLTSGALQRVMQQTPPPPKWLSLPDYIFALQDCLEAPANFRLLKPQAETALISGTWQVTCGGCYWWLVRMCF